MRNFLNPFLLRDAYQVRELLRLLVDGDGLRQPHEPLQGVDASFRISAMVVREVMQTRSSTSSAQSIRSGSSMAASAVQAPLEFGPVRQLPEAGVIRRSRAHPRARGRGIEELLEDGHDETHGAVLALHGAVEFLGHVRVVSS